jgi:hypothetical protein
VETSVPAQRGVRRGEPRDGNAEGRAGHIVQTQTVTEVDAGGVAAVLSADADLEITKGFTGRMPVLM